MVPNPWEALAARTSSDPWTAAVEAETINPAPEQINAQADMPYTAGISALAASESNDLTELMGQIGNLTEQYRERIRASGDLAVRQEFAAREADQQLATLSRLATENTPDLPTNFGEQSRALAAEVLARSEAEGAAAARERAAVNRITDLAAAGNHVQAQVELNALENNGSAYDVVRRMNARRMILRREMEAARTRVEDQGWLSHGLDFIISSIPFVNSTQSIRNIDIDRSLTRWYDFLLTGRRQAMEADTLWDSDDATFERIVRDQLIPRLQNHDNIPGFPTYHNDTAELELWTRIAGDFQTPYSLSANPASRGVLTGLSDPNTVNALDNLGWIPFVSGSRRALSVVGQVNRLGARREAARLVAQRAMDDYLRGASDNMGVSSAEVIDNLAVSAINPNGSDATVPLAAEAGAHFERGLQLNAQLGDTLQPGRFQNPEEFQRALTRFVERTEREFGIPVVNAEVLTPTRLADGSITNRVRLTLGADDSGRGFLTEGEAQARVQSLGYADARIEGALQFPDGREIRVEPGVPVSRQPDFMSWFRGSTVVDEAGQPLRVYRGELNNPGTTEPWVLSKQYNATFFTPDPKTAKRFNGGHNSGPYDGARTLAAYLRVVNPFDYRNKSDMDRLINYIEDLRNDPTTGKLSLDEWLDGPGSYSKTWNDKAIEVEYNYYLSKGLSNPAWNIDLTDLRKGNWQFMENSLVQDWIRTEGFDAFWVDGSEGRNIAVYNTDQIVNALDPSDLLGKTIRDDSGQFFAHIDLDVPETGFYTNTLNGKASNILSRLLLNARQIGDNLLGNAGQTAGNARRRRLAAIRQQYSEVFNSLSNAERQRLGQVLAKGESEGRWFTEAEINGLYDRAYNRAPTAKEHQAYRTAIDVNDLEFSLRNDDIYKQKLLRGVQTLSFPDGFGEQFDRVNGFVDRTMASAPKVRVYNTVTRKHHNRGGQGGAYAEPPLTDAQMQGFRDQGYVLITTEEPVRLSDGVTVNNFLVRNTDVAVENLRRDQLAYRAGGHRMYENKHFVKQTQVGRQPDTGTEFLLSPRTFIAGTRAETREWANTMEAARLAYVNDEGIERIDQIFGGRAGYPTAEEFMAGMDDGMYSRDHKFVSLYDRETPEEYHITDNPEALAFIDPEEGGFEGYLRTQGRMYYSPKGQQLKDYQGALAPTMDPFEVINRSLTNIANLSSLADYKLQATERWVNTYRRYLDPNSVARNASDMTWFLQAQPLGGNWPNKSQIVNSLEAQRDVIRRTLGWRTQFDIRKDELTRGLMDWVAGPDTNGSFNQLRNKLSLAADWWDKANPVQQARGLAFDMKLGLFNISQLPLQAATAASAVALSPKHGFQGLFNYYPVRMMLTKTADESTVNFLTERFRGLAGFDDADEYKAFLRSSRSSGFFDFDGSHTMMNEYGPNATLSEFGQAADKLRQAGRFFFNEGEMFNRAVAWHIAWRETRAAMPDVDISSSQFLNKVAGRAEDFSFSMSNESNAWWQRGVMSVPTQFWAYAARNLEALLGSQFTPAQKLRLITMQAVLFGSAGIPLVPLVSEQLQARAGNAPDMDSRDPTDMVVASLDRGLLDRLIYEVTGTDAQVSARYGTGAWLTDTIKDLFGLSQFGERSAAEVFGGATYSIASDTVGALRQVARYALAESGDPDIQLTDDALLRLARNISTVSQGLKAYTVYAYGRLETNNGRVISNTIPSRDAWAYALGLQPGLQDDLSAMMSFQQRQTEAAAEAANVYVRYRQQLVDHPEQAEELMQEISAFSRLLPPEVRTRALRQAQRNTGQGIYESMSDRIQRQRSQREALERLEGNGGAN